MLQPKYPPDRLWLIERCGLHPDVAGWLAALQADVKENRRRVHRVHAELILLWVLVVWGGISYLVH